MDYILKKYCPRIEFDSYEDFYENFRIEVPENFNFAYDVVDEWARVEPEKKALVWINDAGEERTFTFTDISRSRTVRPTRFGSSAFARATSS
ncbi:MAG: hypothetical protein V8R08_04085 [Coriobacteriales bacterium]